jgi:hypothetical protein
MPNKSIKLMVFKLRFFAIRCAHIMAIKRNLKTTAYTGVMCGKKLKPKNFG